MPHSRLTVRRFHSCPPPYTVAACRAASSGPYPRDDAPAVIIRLFWISTNRSILSHAATTGSDEKGGKRAVSAATHQAADGGHHFRRHLVGPAVLGALLHAVPGVVVEQPERHLVQGRLDGADLREHVNAV